MMRRATEGKGGFKRQRCARLLKLEVGVGAKPLGLASVNLWNEIQCVTTEVECVTMEVKGIKVGLTKVEGTAALAVMPIRPIRALLICNRSVSPRLK